MARKKQHQDLYAYMNGIRVGSLTREANRTLVFTYDNDWLTRKGARPISLSMPLTEIPYKGHIVDCYFDNLLPDNDVIRKRIQARFSAPSENCFDLLSYIGADCIGALQLLIQSKVSNIKTVLANPINDKEIATLLKHYQTAPLGMDRETDFRISIAGAQEKTALLWHQKNWHLPQGPTPTSHIIKLPMGYIKHANIDLTDSVENEWLCLKILSTYDLPVNYARIVNFKDVKTLVVERFDRRWDENSNWLMRLPQEDLCQALAIPPGLKYESDGGPGIQSIMNLLLGSQNALADREQFMKSIFLFWVMGAIDGHAKNFSIFIEPEGRYKLTPLYDVISAYPIAAKRQIEWRAMKIAFSLKGKSRHYLWDTIQIRHWLSTAAQCQFSERMMQNIIDDVFDNMDQVINRVADSLPNKFPEQISESIFSGMRQIKNRSLSK
jgi:serine/threonine-protein kinase HipA